jgi:hypothetical protein
MTIKTDLALRSLNNNNNNNTLFFNRLYLSFYHYCWYTLTSTLQKWAMTIKQHWPGLALLEQQRQQQQQQQQ